MICKRSVLGGSFKLPGLFTILLVITLLATAKPGVCNPRFVYSDSFMDRNQIADHLESVPTNQRGLRAIFAEGIHLTEELLKILPHGIPSIVSGGLFAEVSDEQFEQLRKIDPTIAISQASGSMKQVQTLAEEPGTNNIPTPWNYTMSGAATLKKFYTLKGKGRTIGIVSLDYPYGHLALQDRVKEHRLFGEPKTARGVKDLHLVHPLGIVAGNDPEMFEGIAPECNIVLALISQKASKAVTLLEAIEWLISLETPPDAILFCTDFSGPAPLPVRRALDACRNAGIIPILPAGNNPNKISGMAALPSCITIGSLDRWKQRALYSGSGPVIFEGQKILKPDCMEPGSAILGPTDHIEYKFGSGTLQGAAHFAGIFLLLKEALPPETAPESIISALLSKCEDIGEPGPDYETGYGLPNPIRAMDHILYPPTDSQGPK